MRHEGKLERPHVLRKTRRVQTRPKNNRKVEKRPGARKVENREKQTNRKGSCFYFLILFCCFWCFFFSLLSFFYLFAKNERQKTQNIVFLLFGFLMFLVFLGFLFDFSRPKTCTDKKIPNVTSNRLRKNGNLDFFFLNHEVFWCSKCWSNPIRSEKSNSFSRWRTFWRRPWCQ